MYRPLLEKKFAVQHFSHILHNLAEKYNYLFSVLFPQIKRKIK